MDKYINPLLIEIDLRMEQYKHPKPGVDTIYIGGGTPSLLEPKSLERLFIKLNDVFNIADNSEITLECNPGTITESKLELFKKAGINRLSIGVQSLNRKELNFLQRIHTPEEAENVLCSARKAGFENISCDLIFAIPGQSEKSWEYTLNKIISLEPEHISAYSLIYEEGTPLYEDWQRGKAKKADIDFEAKLYEICAEKLSSAGYLHYEVSNFAQPGKKCLHNLKYWRGEEYFAFGASAHGFINGIRYWNFKNINKYFELIESGWLPQEGSESPDKYARMTETLLLGLRAEGIDIVDFNNQYNINLIDKLKGFVESLIKKGLAVINGNILSLTSKGYLLADRIAVEMLAEIDKKMKKRKYYMANS